MTKLTDHELAVLGHLAQGYNQREVSKRMKLTPQEVNGAVNYIRKKRGSLSRAIEWYMEQNQDQFAADELPDEDEPAVTVQRCPRCDLAEPHECMQAEQFIRRQHDGYVNRGSNGPSGRHTLSWVHRDTGLERIGNVNLTAPVGAGARKRG